MADERLRDQFATFYDELAHREWTSPSVQTKWMGYLFHITSLENAVSIINSGMLYSRNIVVASDLMHTNNADTDIIEATEDAIKDCVRLYFGPRVPTFYYNEGFRSKQEIAQSRFSAHCPMPVAFVFDAPRILATSGTRFSDGNLASSFAQQFTELEDFRRLPFDKIYHRGSIPASAPKEEIVFHRQAEVIVPNQLELLPALVGIFCRSDAEMATLRHLLLPDVATKHARQLWTNTDGTLFEAKRLFVESVNIVGDQAKFVFNPPRNNFGFEAVFEADFDLKGIPDITENWHLEPRMHRRVAIPIDMNSRGPGPVELTLLLDDNIAYKSTHWLLADDWITF